MPTRLLYYSPSALGGLADYARCQAAAVAAMGVAVRFLTAAGTEPVASGVETVPVLGRPRVSGNRWRRRLGSVAAVLRNGRMVEREVRAGGYRQVLFESYSEFLAPFWTGPLRRLAREGVVFGSVVHDPVRDCVVGPQWWHRRSVRAAYSFVRDAFVHEAVELATGLPPGRVRTTVVPHGPYRFPGARRDRATVRAALAIPAAAEVWLAFGHIRDGKNLDLVIRALASSPRSILVVAGRELSASQRPVGFYQRLAADLGVAQQCRWLNRHIAADEIGDLYGASDLAVLAYNAGFCSASGVLNAAVQFRVPCLASGGKGNLQTVVKDYDLGVWVEPDDPAAVVVGLERWRARPPKPQWSRYETENSWTENARRVWAALTAS